LEAAEREARESLARGDSIENAAYDLKAVNPNRVSKEDKRTPDQLLEFIDARGRDADAALKSLRELLDQ
jgi:type I restriction enzyme M protein